MHRRVSDITALEGAAGAGRRQRRLYFAGPLRELRYAQPVPTPEEFESYFVQRAELADELFKRGFRTDAFLIATVAIDSIGAIWQHDFAQPFESGPLNFAAFLSAFGGDPETNKICVVFLAEDMIAFGSSRLHAVARRMLQKRAADPTVKVEENEFRECPHAHEDATWTDLIKEEPALANEAELEKIARQYTRAALTYRLYRCGPGHAYSRGSRTSGFADPRDDDEISYFPAHVVRGALQPISLHIGLHTVTRWLRASASNCASQYRTAGKVIAASLDASSESLDNLKAKWFKSGQPRV